MKEPHMFLLDDPPVFPSRLKQVRLDSSVAAERGEVPLEGDPGLLHGYMKALAECAPTEDDVSDGVEIDTKTLRSYSNALRAFRSVGVKVCLRTGRVENNSHSDSLAASHGLAATLFAQARGSFSHLFDDLPRIPARVLGNKIEFMSVAETLAAREKAALEKEAAKTPPAPSRRRI